MDIKRNREHFRGCFLGGAICDALGYPVEFMSYKEILRVYGIHGITDLDKKGKDKAEISDDTQMTIFTVEGVLRADTRWGIRGLCHMPTIVYYSYIRWLHTQEIVCEEKSLP